ncbi:MAG: M23 family metallopeptidase [Alphaproteobacteria bacterium]|nr:M23 family metallopeptidase [Alphaproteobacteria bacterium]
MSSFFASVRTIFRPITLTVVLVAGLHLSIGVLALRAIVHPAATATMVTAAKTELSAKAATPVKAAETTPAALAKAPPPVPVTADATADASSPAVAKPASHATLFGPLLLARESVGLAQLRAAGINLETLLHHAEPHHRRVADEGGPFVPVAAMREAALDPARLARLEQLIAHMPFAAPLVHYEVSSHFGVRRDPFDGEREFHTGIDLEANIGTPVHATAPGVVDFAGWDGGYGRMVEIDHGNGIHTRYGHLSRILVRAGDRVVRHERIGLVGNTGRSTGPHLHYEVRIDGRPLNPAKFLAAGRIELVKAITTASR